MKKRDTGINNTDQERRLGTVDEVRLWPADIDASGTALTVDGLAGVVKRPLICILGVCRLCFTDEIRLGIKNDSLARDFGTIINRGSFCLVERIDVNSEKLDFLI